MTLATAVKNRPFRTLISRPWSPGSWSAQALTDASTNAHRPAPVGQVDFTHLHLELQHWYPGEGAILVSGYIKYAATSVVPSYRAYFGCKRCYGGRSRWWTADGARTGT